MPVKKMTISDAKDASKKFTLQLNPAALERERNVQYAYDAPNGALGAECRFVKQLPETLAFEIVFDGTGVLENSKPVEDQINNLAKIVYDYNGANHAPNEVKVSWGNELFKGKLAKMKREVTLYTPEGVPLRARLKLCFRGSMNAKEQNKKANKSSPDMTHIVKVKAGDTLPLLCRRIYKSAKYYPEIARVNRLVNFRRLEPGTELVFPPLK